MFEVAQDGAGTAVTSCIQKFRMSLGMPWIALSEISIFDLIQLIMSAVLTGYFVTLKDKSRYTWLILLFFVFTTLFLATQFFTALTGSIGATVSNRLGYVFGLPTLLSILAFAYTFPAAYRPREARWMLSIFAALTAAPIVYIVANLVLNGIDFEMPPQLLLQSVALLILSWTIGVFVRRARRKEYLWKAHRAFGSLFLLIPLSVFALALAELGVIMWDMATVLFSLGLLFFLTGFALVYINHAPRPTTFQVKLVGLSLFTVLATLCVVTGLLFTGDWFDQVNRESIEPHAIRFEPTGPTTYRAVPIPVRPLPAIGDPISLRISSETPVDLGFEFPFAGARSSLLYLSMTAAVPGQRWEEPHPLSVFDEVPKLFPLTGRWARPGPTPAHVSRAAGEVTIRLARQGSGDDPEMYVYMRLFENGTIEFHYPTRVASIHTVLRGLTASGERVDRGAALQVVPLSKQPHGAVFIEDFATKYRMRAHQTLVPLALSLLAVTAFILLIFPLFFRVSLIKPLERLLSGVQRVNSGDLDAAVPVGMPDEIGRLTDHFNGMTASLRRSRAELKDYADHLEDKVAERTSELAEKNEENERLLLNILPGPIAERLKTSDEPISDAFGDVTVLFSDLVGFTVLSQQVDADRLVYLLNDLFSRYDALAQELGVEKIKTIGDAYMAVCGLPVERPDHAAVAARMALGMFEATAEFNREQGTDLQVRIGLNSGPVVAGVIGTHKFIYDLWGDTVNTAARMESHGVPGRVHVSESTWAQLEGAFEAEARGAIQVKGKGEMKTFLLEPTRADTDAQLTTAHPTTPTA